MQADGGGLNWVEALPRALTVRHDMVDPELGLTPYEVVFGRERHMSGLPYQSMRECPDAEEFFSHMEMIDRLVAKHWNESHRKLEERVNAHRSPLVSHGRGAFEVGSWVWVLRPKAIVGP